ncbi:hypothetical protein ASF62_03340 [Leifsonia sp. Leaf325]|nr:SRPBCC domain-containing protein [Leifsonia sp. Leaf325]KQQ95564.1 hypothetical protein ASF62_03340 [Leifsonia sp. Leaf325]
MRDVVVEIELPIGVRSAWSLLTDRRHTWWSDLDFDAVADAPLIERWLDDDGREVTALGTIVDVDPPHRLSFVWTDPGAVQTTVEWVVTATDGGGSIVTVRESGLDAAGALQHEEGWRHHLDRLRAAVSRP